MFHQLILTIAVLGLIVNLIALLIIGRKKHRTMFHDLLIILTISDVAVVICCALQFALPFLWEAYSSKAYPHILQFLLPIMHITVMISVYTTILISFERYVRICFYCQLRETSILSEDNIKLYKCFVVLFPLLFYIPKFFEVRSHHEVIETQIEVDCQKYILLASYLENPFLRSYVVKELTQSEIEKTEHLSRVCSQLVANQTSFKLNLGTSTGERRNQSFPALRPRANSSEAKTRFDTLKLTTRSTKSTSTELINLRQKRQTDHAMTTTTETLGLTKKERSPSISGAKESNNKTAKTSTFTRQTLLRNITTSKKVSLTVIPTPLRKNVYYYKIYYVYLNTIFASILPLALLLFLNITTAIELIKMSRQESRIVARNTSIVILPPKITMSQCSGHRMSLAQSVVRMTETTIEDECLEALQPFTSYPNDLIEMSDVIQLATMQNDDSVQDVQNETSSTKQNNNDYNNVKKPNDCSAETLDEQSETNCDIPRETLSGLISPPNGQSSRNESRRNTITYDFGGSGMKSPTSADLENVSRLPYQGSSHSQSGNQYRRRKNGRS